MSSAQRPRVAVVRRAGDWLYASGQVAVRDGVLLAHGRVGDDVDLDTARACARQCAENVLDAVREATGSLDAVTPVKLTVYVAGTPDFQDQHLVADAATEHVLSVFGPQGEHARAAIGVAALPLGSPVEVEAVFLAGAR